MPLQYFPRVRFERLVVTSFSRKPTRTEYSFMNLLEHHSERCEKCELLLCGHFPDQGVCRRGRILVNFVLRSFVVERDGKIYSTDDEFGLPVRVEVSRHYWAVHGVLKGFYPRHYRHYRINT